MSLSAPPPTLHCTVHTSLPSSPICNLQHSHAETTFPPSRQLCFPFPVLQPNLNPTQIQGSGHLVVRLFCPAPLRCWCILNLLCFLSSPTHIPTPLHTLLSFIYQLLVFRPPPNSNLLFRLPSPPPLLFITIRSFAQAATASVWCFVIKRPKATTTLPSL